MAGPPSRYRPEADVGGSDPFVNLHPDNLTTDERMLEIDIDRFFAEYAKNAGSRGDAKRATE